jgi:biotin/methionine sulfoxide reductase
MFSEFREDPQRSPLITPSGKIEIFSEAVDSFDYDDCPGHPCWIEPDEWLGSTEVSRLPLQLIANNPGTRLHSQLDMGEYSQASKVRRREPLRMHPEDAAIRAVTDGDIVRVFNDRGSCLAGVVISDVIRRGVVQLSTGAWFDPVLIDGAGDVCAHGNPNVLTADVGSSRLSQGCSGQHALVQVEKFMEEPPELSVLAPPAIARDLDLPSAGTGTTDGAKMRLDMEG